MSTVIKAENVGKRYVKYDDAPMLATAVLRMRTRTQRSRLWAVRNVDLQVGQSECVGVIGRNGSGKSTLLQVVSGITAPTEGRVRVVGRVAPLIAVGVGFHPELSGRDNVYLNGTILGMNRAEIDARFDEILAFSELEAFIDTPLKFYSSGMAVRLGFAVAIQADPSVLIVDEVLAVGDFAFQLKCFERIEQIRANGATILVVSHNLNAIRRLSDRVVVLHKGAKDFEGDVTSGISRFHVLMDEARDAEAGPTTDSRVVPMVPGYGEPVDREILNAAGDVVTYVDAGEEVVARVRVNALRDIDAPFVNLVLESESGIVVYQDSNWNRPGPPIRKGQTADFAARFPASLPTGTYTAKVTAGQILDGSPARLFEVSLLTFYVAGRSGVRGLVDLDAQFPVQPA
jgi:ABC-type polysaccharide/polyol phosphate transport system ATPase subunit